MAVVSFNLYAKFFQALANKEIDFNSDTLKITAHTNSYTPNATTHDYVDDLSGELSTASGYTSGGATLTGSFTHTVANSWSSTWATATAYTVGQIRRPTTGNTYLYRVVVAGTSHASTEPTWPTVIGQTVSDSGVTWACVGRSVLILDVTDGEVWAAPFDAGPFRHLVLSDRTPVGAGNQPLIGYFTYGSDQTGGGGNFALTTPVEGLIAIPIP